MAMWDGKKIVYFKDKSLDNYPSWVLVDCGCCGGTQWGGEEPIECDTCNGSGGYCKQIKSGVLAMYPGGSFF